MFPGSVSPCGPHVVWQEMQRIGPNIRAIFDDWGTPERQRAAHNHLLAALSMRPMGNYDYAFVQREVLRTFPIDQVQHLFCVLCNGSGCAVQVLQTPCLSPRGEAPGLEPKGLVVAPAL